MLTCFEPSIGAKIAVDVPLCILCIPLSTLLCVPCQIIIGYCLEAVFAVARGASMVLCLMLLTPLDGVCPWEAAPHLLTMVSVNGTRDAVAVSSRQGRICYGFVTDSSRTHLYTLSCCVLWCFLSLAWLPNFAPHCFFLDGM